MNKNDTKKSQKRKNGTVLKMSWLAAFGISICIGDNARGDNLDVSISPSSDQIIAINGYVNFSCTGKGGCPPYTYAWSFSGGTATDSQYTQQNPGSVSFGEDADGTSNYVSVTITDAQGNTDFDDMTVWVPEIQSDDDDTIWWFNGQQPPNYSETTTLNVNGIPDGTPFTLTVSAGTSIVSLYDPSSSGPPGSSSVTPSGNSVIGISIGASNPDQQNDVSITLSVNGTNMDVYQLTVRSPDDDTLQEGYPNTTLVASTTFFAQSGWCKLTTFYSYTVQDQFGDDLPYDYPMNESFSPFSSDYTDETWASVYAPPNGKIITASSAFGDDFKITGNWVRSPALAVPGCTVYPHPCFPASKHANEAVCHNDSQKYKVGSTNIGQGTLIDDHLLQWNRSQIVEQ